LRNLQHIQTAPDSEPYCCWSVTCPCSRACRCIGWQDASSILLCAVRSHVACGRCSRGCQASRHKFWQVDRDQVVRGAERRQVSRPEGARPVCGRADSRIYLGAFHEITERLFVVRRAFRVNDTLPGDTATASGWVWQRGGWLLVDRSTGQISAIALPEFDPYCSVASWYRDYAAYCGVSDDGVVS